MAKINRQYCFYDGPSPWTGIGWAAMPLDWIGWGKRGGEFCPTIYHGKLWLRSLGIDRSEPGYLYVVEAHNWRWPLWWFLLRIWLFLRWFERNLRLTAAVWGLLKCEMGAMPRWGDFVVWRWVKKKETNREKGD